MHFLGSEKVLWLINITGWIIYEIKIRSCEWLKVRQFFRHECQSVEGCILGCRGIFVAESDKLPSLCHVTCGVFNTGNATEHFLCALVPLFVCLYVMMHIPFFGFTPFHWSTRSWICQEMLRFTSKAWRKEELFLVNMDVNNAGLNLQRSRKCDIKDTQSTLTT